MRTLTGSLLQIPRFAIFAGYLTIMSAIFIITTIVSFPFWLVGQIKHQILP